MSCKMFHFHHGTPPSSDSAVLPDRCAGQLVARPASPGGAPGRSDLRDAAEDLRQRLCRLQPECLHQHRLQADVQGAGEYGAASPGPQPGSPGVGGAHCAGLPSGQDDKQSGPHAVAIRSERRGGHVSLKKNIYIISNNNIIIYNH